LLLIFALWTAAPQYAPRPAHDAWIGVAIFLGYYALLVLVMGVWGRLLARRVSTNNLRRNLRRFHVTLLVARAMIPIWFAFGVFGLGWGEVVHKALGFETLRACELPGLLLATLPPMAAWMGLWWSQYPAEIALREQSLLGAIEADLPIHAPPRFRDYFTSNLRLRLLFTAVPIFLVVLLRDLVLLAGRSSHLNIGEHWLELIATVLALTIVFVFAPEILRRVLDTVPLEDGRLRRKLEAMCERSRMRVQDILVWRTHNNMGNAAVMGVLPQMRYVLLSDLLLESMTDEQVEAVFAHEMGHVVHRHMPWFVVFFITIMISLLGGAEWLDKMGFVRDLPEWMKPVIVSGGFFWVILLFGFLSRRFERQADVFAARTMQSMQPGVPGVPGVPGETSRSHVGEYGAKLFTSALGRVAAINNMPTGSYRRWEGGLRKRFAFLMERASDLAHHWLHGSIKERQDYLQRISANPAQTFRFDRFMMHLSLTLLFLLAASSAFLWSVR
jgi:STE24 endopeptidase